MNMARIAPGDSFAFPPSLEVRCAGDSEHKDDLQGCTTVAIGHGWPKPLHESDLPQHIHIVVRRRLTQRGPFLYLRLGGFGRESTNRQLLTLIIYWESHFWHSCNFGDWLEGAILV